MPSFRILVVEPLAALTALLRAQLEACGHRVHCAATGEAARLRAAGGELDLIVLDPEVDGACDLSLIGDLAARANAAVIATSANGSIAQAVAAMRAGAADYLVKPVGRDRLLGAIDIAMSAARATARLKGALPGPAQPVPALHRFIGSSPLMQEVYRRIRAVARSSAPVFVTGESGTGKELCAEAIHEAGPRAGGPFVALNCAAIPRDLLESEVFGHVKGAFTGAIADRVGAAKLAGGGTLFLDEVCELAPVLQTKLLRFLQTGIVQPVGSPSGERVDVRIVCATNRVPAAEVKAGRFREDLYFRLHVLPVHLPPLRLRGDDVLALARAFLADYAAEEGRAFARLSDDAAHALMAHPWPGNVRELQNTLRRAVVMNEGETITAAMLALDEGEALVGIEPDFDAAADGSVSALRSLGSRLSGELKTIQRGAIEQAIAACDGSIPRAARLLGVAASTVYRRREAWTEEARRKN